MLSISNHDISVTDIVMPDISGIEFIKMIRKKTDKLPVIAITAHNDIDDAYEFISLGVFTYLKKPLADINSFKLTVINALGMNTTSALSGLKQQFRCNQ